jgi:hypothetical protein
MPLPWSTVNEVAPAAIAAILELRRSPYGGRKRCCPFCGGRNLSPLKRAFFCYSGCGGRAYSNVDTAAAHWKMSPAEACARLALALGIAVVDPPLPWREVGQARTLDVARVLSLRRTKSEWLWDCPTCGGPGTLRSYRRKWRCSNPPCATDAQNGWREHVDVAMAVWGSTAADACIRLAAALRIAPVPAVPDRARELRSEEESPRNRALATIDARPGANRPPEFNRLLLRHLRLGRLGRQELLRRHFDVAAAEAYGFRSVEPGEWQSRVLPFMAAFGDDELTAAGFPPRHPGRGHARRAPWWPGYGRAPLLVIPFWDGNRLAGIRFRNLADPRATSCPRYVSPVDVPPEVPFHAAALTSGAHTIFALEGELNALVALLDPYLATACGIPGAHIWLDDWSASIRDSTRYVVGCFDQDPAGQRGAIRVRDSLARVRGFAWAYHRWRTCFFTQDACELHTTGGLASFFLRAPWISQETSGLWADPIDLGTPPRQNRRP